MLALAEKRVGKAHQITTEIVTISPEMAAEWLIKNVKNRKLSSSTVDKYAKDMRAGLWKLTGDAIRFDKTTKLLDGQHRLRACVRAQAPFQSFVMYGLEPESQDAMDMGKSRSASDVLGLSGLSNSVSIASTVRVLLSERDGNPEPRGKQFSTAMVIETLKRHQNLPRYALTPGVAPHGIVPGHVGYIRYVAAELLNEHERAEAMISVIKSGIPDYDGDPIHIYRERIIRMRDEALTIRRGSRWFTLKNCWNMFRQRRAVSLLKFSNKPIDIDGLDLSKL